MYPIVSSLLALQTNRSRVEAAQASEASATQNLLQTNRSRVEASSGRSEGCAVSGYRRTVVGLKLGELRVIREERWLQTNRSRVEAPSGPRLSSVGSCYRRTVVGLKLIVE